MTTRHLALAFCLIALPAAAEEGGWTPLAGDALEAALAGRTLSYGPDDQTFYETGRTRYRLLGSRWGWWEIREGRYCALWPPREDWDCFDTHTRGEVIRFTGPEGEIYLGTYAE